MVLTGAPGPCTVELGNGSSNPLEVSAVEFLPTLRLGGGRFRGVCASVGTALPAGRRRRPRRLGRRARAACPSRAPSSRSSARGSRAAAWSRSPTARASSCCPRCPPGSYTLRAVEQGPRALGRSARDRAAQPRRALHAEPHAGGRDGRGDRHERHDRQPVRVALAGAPQAPLRAGDGRARAAGAGRHEGRDARARLWPPCSAHSTAASSSRRRLDRATDARRAASGRPSEWERCSLQGRLAERVKWTLGGLMSENEGAPGGSRPSSCSSRAAATSSRSAPATARATGPTALLSGCPSPTARSVRHSSATAGSSASASRPPPGCATPTSASCRTRTTPTPWCRWRSRATPTASCTARSRRARSHPAATC